MRKLSDVAYNNIIRNMDLGDQKAKFDYLDEAISFYQKALEQIPDPKVNWEISLHVFTALVILILGLGVKQMSTTTKHCYVLTVLVMDIFG